MDENFNSDVVNFLVSYYEKHLWKLIERSIPIKMSKKNLDYYKSDFLYRSLEFCSKNKKKFNPQKGTNPETYFAQILKNLVYRECMDIRKNPEYKRLCREKKIDEILNEDSSIESPNLDNTSFFSF